MEVVFDWNEEFIRALLDSWIAEGMSEKEAREMYMEMAEAGTKGYES